MQAARHVPSHNLTSRTFPLQVFYQNHQRLRVNQLTSQEIVPKLRSTATVSLLLTVDLIAIIVSNKLMITIFIYIYNIQ